MLKFRQMSLWRLVSGLFAVLVCLHLLRSIFGSRGHAWPPLLMLAGAVEKSVALPFVILIAGLAWRTAMRPGKEPTRRL